MNRTASTTADPTSIFALKEAFLRGILGPLKGSRFAWRYAGGVAYLPLGRYRLGMVTLTGCNDEDEPEFTGLRVEVRLGDKTLHSQDVAFGDMHPLDFTGKQGEVRRVLVLAVTDPDMDGSGPALRLVAMPFEDGTLEGRSWPRLEPSASWMGPVMDVLKAWAE